MREITESAVKERKRARRDKNRRAHFGKQPNEITLAVPGDEIDDDSEVKPFEVEDWLNIVDIAVPGDEVVADSQIRPFEVEEW